MASRPKDLKVISSLLQELGITEYENGVENHLLDFINRSVTTLIEDCTLYSNHAGKKCIDTEDAKLAIELQQHQNYVTPPSREVTATLARQRNNTPLPTIRSSAGLRLPPDRYSLLSCNYHLKSTAKKARNVHTVPRASNITQATPIAPRPTLNVQKPVQSPIIKFSEANKGMTPITSIAALSPVSSTAPVSSINSSVNAQILMPTVGILNNEIKLSNDVNPNKRPHEEDDDYDN